MKVVSLCLLFLASPLVSMAANVRHHQPVLEGPANARPHPDERPDPCFEMDKAYNIHFHDIAALNMEDMEMSVCNDESREMIMTFIGGLDLEDMDECEVKLYGSLVVNKDVSLTYLSSEEACIDEVDKEFPLTAYAKHDSKLTGSTSSRELIGEPIIIAALITAAAASGISVWQYISTYCNGKKDWPRGQICALGTTCDCCADTATYWWGKAATACGQDSCWPRDTWCLGGTSCNQCCNGAQYWWSYWSYYCN